jgi:hypothetical protein
LPAATATSRAISLLDAEFALEVAMLVAGSTTRLQADSIMVSLMLSVIL